jgi:hypothetical protein
MVGKDFWLRAIFGRTFARIYGRHLRWVPAPRADNCNERRKPSPWRW